MKLFGSKNTKPKHKSGAHAKSAPPVALRIVAIFLCVVAVSAVGLYAWLKLGLQAPDVSSRTRGSTATEETGAPVDTETHEAPPEDLPDTPAVTPEPTEAPPEETPEDNTPAPAGSAGKKYTFAILGMDNGFGNSDTIMTATFDAENYTLSVVSIPRDTLVNVSWYTKKANTWYSHGGKEQGVLNGMRDLVGYALDYYAIIDLDAFIKLVDSIGGVYFDVPQNMKYSDPYQDLYIDIKAGPQTLNGEDAMKVVRFRRYMEGDIKRISVQQDFMMTMVQQILENVNAIPITTLADIVLNDVDTDMDYPTILWFAREMMKLDAENVSFHTLPGNYGDSVNDTSYVTIYVNKWLEMVNTYLNPFEEPIQKNEVDILTRDSAGKLYATSGIKRGSASWGS